MDDDYISPFGYPQGIPPQIPGGSLRFDRDDKQDLIRYQLDISKTKADILHILNGDMEVTKENFTEWEINEKEAYKVLNDLGVREVMRVVNCYLTKDVIMSNLKEEKIAEICRVLGRELNDLFFTKSDEIGLDTDSKRKNYSIIIVNILHIIYITLMRAKDGQERKGVTENKVVNQSEVNYPGMQRGGLSLNPFRLFGRR